MGKVSARPVAFEGRSLHVPYDPDTGEPEIPASVDEALDALSRLAVLTTIAEDEKLANERPDIAVRAREAIARLATAGPIADDDAKEISREAAGVRGPEPYELRLKIELEIVTRPYNQWVRDIAAIGTPVGG
jgi:hypothetical protein